MQRMFYPKNDNSNANPMLVLKKKILKKCQNITFCAKDGKKWNDTNSKVLASLLGVRIPCSRHSLAFKLTLLQLGLLRVVTWPGSRFLERKIFRLKIFGAHPLHDILQT